MDVKRVGAGAMVLGAVACGASLAVVAAAGERESTMKASERIEVEVLVDAKLSDVWHAWTTNEGVRSFFADESQVDLAIGGPYEMYFLPDAERGKRGGEGCRVLSYLPEEMLSFSWNAPPKFAHARQHFTWVVLRFDEPMPGKVRVRLTHLGWQEMQAAHPEHAEEWNQVREYFSKAWPRVLTNLKARFE